MVTISKPLSAGQAQAYHKEEFTNARENYYTQGDQIHGEWQGQLAERWGLSGEVMAEQFQRLTEGQDPNTGEQLVQHRGSYHYENKRGEKVHSMEHRAGWDATFSAPKSVSLTALVGGDERIREAHRESVRVSLDEMEHFVQARMGGNHAPETTGNWVAAKFEHDSARPVNGYSAPQLHTHVVFFNMTETESSDIRAIQPQEIYRTQQYGTAIYQSELAHRLKDLGYEIERGKNGAPEIKGYSNEYVEASSPRRQQIENYLEQEGRSGAGPAQIAAHRTREDKLSLSREETLERHRALAGEYGNQADRVVAEARERGPQFDHEEGYHHAQIGVTYGRDRNLERESLTDERHLMRDALRHSMGRATLDQVKADFADRQSSGEFVEVAHPRSDSPARAYTTEETLALEQANIDRMKHGQGKNEPIARQKTLDYIDRHFDTLNEDQRGAVRQVLSNEDQIQGIQGTAGSGKTTTLKAIREGAEREGYEVSGLAPTSRAAHQLNEAGIESETLQHHLMSDRHDSGRRHLYFVDESSLASTRQVNEFVERLSKNDRVVLVGDTRQHQAVEAGRPFEQMQDGGMHTARLDTIVRQQDPALREAVEQLARGEVRQAMQSLENQGRIHEIADRNERMTAIANAYADRPEKTLVVSPDNQSRAEINRRIHEELQSRGMVSEEERTLPVLTPRQDLTGADRRWAAQYEPGDIVRYSRSSAKLHIEAGEYARVTAVDAEQNLLTVERAGGRHLTYDPDRLHGVNVYRESARDFSEGDRIQFTARYSEEDVPNRELGTIEKIDATGNLDVRVDSGRELRFNIREHPHIDYGYAATSHSSQSQTVERVFVHVDTEHTHQDLINQRLGYVAISRGSHDVQLYTNNAQEMREGLEAQTSKHAALEALEEARSRYHGDEQRVDRIQEVELTDQTKHSYKIEHFYSRDQQQHEREHKHDQEIGHSRGV
jgi:conjugative relaxase-like TrwC/TraI family protein